MSFFKLRNGVGERVGRKAKGELEVEAGTGQPWCPRGRG